MARFVYDLIVKLIGCSVFSGRACRRIMFIAVIGSSCAIFAHCSLAATFPHDPDQQVRDSLFEGVTIDSIAVESRNIFDTSIPRYDKWMYRIANKLHLTSRTRIVRVELLFAVGDAFSWEQAYETEKNLRQRMAIYDARVTPRRLGDGRLLVEVVTIDVWSLSGGVDVQSEGGETDVDINLEERNLMGMNQYVALHYTDLAKERAFLSGVFHDQRLASKPMALQVSWQNGDHFHYARMGLSRPMYALRDKWSAALLLSDEGGRYDLYHDTMLVGQNYFDAQYVMFSGRHRFGPSRSKITLLAGYSHYDRRSRDLKVLSFDSANIASRLPSDSLYYSVSGGVSLSDERFRGLRHIDAFTKVEDIPSGLFMTGVFEDTRRGSASLFHSYAAGGSYALHFRGVLAYISAEATWWKQNGSQLRRKRIASFRWYYNHQSYLTIALRGTYLEDSRKEGGEPIALGGKTGLRGYDNRFATGQRVAIAGLETRWFPGFEFLSAYIGGVTFVDAARSFGKEESFTLSDFYLSAGFGLRIAPERVSRGRPIRIDFAYSQKYGWSISASSGQYFSLLSDNFPLTSR